MYTLMISIACSVAVSVLLKLARRQHVDVAQAITINYAVAAGLCILLLRPQPASLFTPSTPWWVLLSLGVLLPTIFLAMAGAVRYAGIVLSDAAQRLSLFIPLIAAFVLFGEVLSSSKLLGISVGIAALVLLLFRPAGSGVSSDRNKGILLLLAVWLGYGTIDILFKQMAKSGAAFSSSLLLSFSLAGVLLLAYLLAKRTAWNLRSMASGIVLGTLNFGNIYFYVRAHQVFSENPTLVFSAMNIGVISLGTLIGAGVFKEKLSWLNGVGIVLALVAIIILIPR